MLVYPQLATGASAQYPAGRRRVRRTVVNQAGGGLAIRYADPGASRVEWQLSYSGLVDEEAAALQAFFQETEGRLKGFVFPDPLGNLLAWSEAFDEAGWTKDPQASLAGGQGDPYGGSQAYRMTNTGAVGQGLRQTLQLPGGRTYCFSIYARCSGTAVATLSIGGARRELKLGADWSRLTATAQPAGTGDTVVAGIEVASGSEVFIFGAQMEGQQGASGYKRTGARSGVYENARFRDDVLRITTEGVNRHSCRVHITHADHL